MARYRWLVVVVLASLSSTAVAQTSREQARSACLEDAQKLCADVERRAGGIRGCLAGQREKLSDRCRKALETRAIVPAYRPPEGQFQEIWKRYFGGSSVLGGVSRPRTPAGA